MRVIEVELWALGGDGAIRTVRIPEDGSLESVFHFGQNDFQPQPRRSVSCGDIIRWDGKRYLVMASGFREVPADFRPDPADPLLSYR